MPSPSQGDLHDALLEHQKNINNFVPPAPPQPTADGSIDLEPTKDAYAEVVATELALALFPIIQQIATEMAQQAVDERISSQLQQLQTDVNNIKQQLGIS